MTSAKPQLWIVAGPNGVGKTTYAFRHIKTVSGSTRFVNLDEIARGLSPLDPSAEQRRAARVALDMTRSLIGDHRSFSIETTMSGKTHLRMIAAAREAGFEINLLFFLTASPEVSLSRIARRVSEGGHDVAEVDVRRRFARAIDNLPLYIGAVDLWRVFDNATLKPKAVAEGTRLHRADRAIRDAAGQALDSARSAADLPRSLSLNSPA